MTLTGALAKPSTWSPTVITGEVNMSHGEHAVITRTSSRRVNRGRTALDGVVTGSRSDDVWPRGGGQAGLRANSRLFPCAPSGKERSNEHELASRPAPPGRARPAAGHARVRGAKTGGGRRQQRDGSPDRRRRGGRRRQRGDHRPGLRQGR